MTTQPAVLRTRWGHVNLDHLTRLSEPEFSNRMGSGGWFVRFFGWFQLHDKPMEFSREVETDESEARFVTLDCGSYHHDLSLTDGSWVLSEPYEMPDGVEITAVRNLRTEDWQPLHDAWLARLKSQEKAQ